MFGVLYYEFQTFPTRIGCKVMVGVALGSVKELGSCVSECIFGGCSLWVQTVITQR